MDENQNLNYIERSISQPTYPAANMSDVLRANKRL